MQGIVMKRLDLINQIIFRKEQINIKAVRSRFNIFKTCSNISFNPDPEIINNIYREAASIAVLCTQKKSYIKL